MAEFSQNSDLQSKSPSPTKKFKENLNLEVCDPSLLLSLEQTAPSEFRQRIFESKLKDIKEKELLEILKKADMLANTRMMHKDGRSYKWELKNVADLQPILKDRNYDNQGDSQSLLELFYPSKDNEFGQKAKHKYLCT